MSGAVRNATHAGSWLVLIFYITGIVLGEVQSIMLNIDNPACRTPVIASIHRYTNNARELNKQLSDWLSAAGAQRGPPARVIISPHAGYSYSGSTAAYAYKQIIPENMTTIFVLGPSHVICLNSCALSNCSRYRTPLGDLSIDQKINAELRDTGAFETMDLHNEESEHSIEMQLPFVAKIMEKQPVGSYNIVPILVGSLSTSRQASYGRIFAKYLSDPRIIFVISSDFCHWDVSMANNPTDQRFLAYLDADSASSAGNTFIRNRFHFTPYDSSTGVPIHEQIASLDKQEAFVLYATPHRQLGTAAGHMSLFQGMDAISRIDPNAFNEYLKKTQNTICGRNPISVILHAAEYFRQMNNHGAEFVFLKYCQSNQCRSLSDSSVSYAAGALFVSPRN